MSSGPESIDGGLQPDIFEYLLGGPVTDEELDNNYYSIQFDSKAEFDTKLEEARTLYPEAQIYVLPAGRLMTEIAIILDQGKFLFASVDLYKE